jgi:hypothetical protein
MGLNLNWWMARDFLWRFFPKIGLVVQIHSFAGYHAG